MIFLIFSGLFSNTNILIGGRIGTFGYDLSSKYEGYLYEVGGSLEMFLNVIDKNYGFEGTIGFSAVPNYGAIWLELYHLRYFPFKTSSLSVGYGLGIFASAFSSTFFAFVLEHNLLDTSLLLLQFQLKLAEHYRDKKFITCIQIGMGAGIKL